MAVNKVAFIGGGQMAQALAGGALQAGVFREDDLLFVEPQSSQQQKLKSKFGQSQVVADLATAFAQCDVLVLSVKPHVLHAIAGDIAGLVSDRHLLVSIAAGIALIDLQSSLGTERVIRVMPNTPAQVGAGASAISTAPGVAPADLQWVECLVNSVGSSVRVPDPLMHAVTGLSGSGPAYIYLVIEALSDGGVASGLSRDVATQLAAQTVLGAARMVLDTGRHPGELKDQVTSPGGTTIAAIRELEAAGVRSAFMEAVVRASERSQDLA